MGAVQAEDPVSGTANVARAAAGVPFFLGCIAWNFAPGLTGAAAPALLRMLVMCGALLQVQLCALTVDDIEGTYCNSLPNCVHFLSAEPCSEPCQCHLCAVGRVCLGRSLRGCAAMT